MREIPPDRASVPGSGGVQGPDRGAFPSDAGADPLVSVVIPTYNRAHLLASTLRSVLAQTYARWECIVVDDASTDDTPGLMRSFCARDARFRYVAQQKASASAARNRGLELARGRYVLFLDSDDCLAPDRLAWQVRVLERDPALVLVYGETLHCTDPTTGEGDLYQAWLRTKPSGHAYEALLQSSSIYSPLVRTERIRALGGFDTGLELAEDWDMWLRLARTGPVRFEPKVSLYYRVHAGNRSGGFREYCCARRVARAHLRRLPLRRRAAVRPGVRRYLQRYVPRLLDEADQLNAGGDWSSAAPIWRAVAGLAPRWLLSARVATNAAWSLLAPRTAPVWWPAERRRAGRGSAERQQVS